MQVTSPKPPRKLPFLTVEDARILAVSKLRHQMGILERRIDEDIEGASSEGMFDGTSWRETLELDLETFYTVAFDLLKVAQLVIAPQKARALRREANYKLIARLRNSLVRHAYDKDDGDCFGMLGVAGDKGPVLRDMSAFNSRWKDPGYHHNRKAVQDLIKRYGLDALPMRKIYSASPFKVRDTTKPIDTGGFGVRRFDPSTDKA
jgi:hypothetical protein